MLDDPHPILHQLREHSPVCWSAFASWWVTGYAETSTGLRDKRFSVDHRNSPAGGAPELSSTSARPSLISAWLRNQVDHPMARICNNFLLLLDPPRHQRLRRLLNPAFEPAQVRGWRPQIEARVDALVAELRRRPAPDLMRDFALPLAIRTLCDLIGLPAEDGPRLQVWASDVFRGTEPMLASNETARISRSSAEFLAYLAEHVAHRRRDPAPRGDLLDALIAAEADGERLSHDELLATCVGLFAAGFDTTANTIGNGTLALLRHPDQLALLRQRPELIETGADELLRYDGAVRGVLRTALDDLELGGARIRRGDPVLFMLLAANRDPAMFPDPDRLDLRRGNARHVALSHGIHYCIGGPLARLELQCAITALARERFAIVPGGLSWRSSVTFRSLERFRIAF